MTSPSHFFASEMFCAAVIHVVTVLVVHLPRISIAEAPSGPPQDVAAVATSSRTVRVTWSDVLATERNGVLTEYEVHIRTSYIVILSMQIHRLIYHHNQHNI